MESIENDIERSIGEVLDILDKLDAENIPLYVRFGKTLIEVDNFELMRVLSKKDPKEIFPLLIKESDEEGYELHDH